jgi:hypothetical protein
MTYGEFATAIGLRGADDHWHIRYREQVVAVLDYLAAIRPANERTLAHRVVNAESGQPGAGLAKSVRIVTETQASPLPSGQAGAPN